MAASTNKGKGWLTSDEVRAFVASRGARSKKEIRAVLDGFDFDKPIYFRQFEAHETLWQFVRNPSHENGDAVRLGHWFTIRGATQDVVAITGGGSGRRRHRFEVTQAFTTVEGTARPQSVNWTWAGGGRGGGTQVYVPSDLLGHVGSLGPDE